MSSWASNPPILRCVAKTHKPVRENGLPQSRLIVGTAKGLTTALGEMISDQIEPIIRICPEKYEAGSTKEVMRLIEETKAEIKESHRGEEIVVASMDVLAFYPSLDQQ